ncbi:serine/threonine protein kinase [Pseudarthrobacter phenanthrenivorans]|uniref:non-specific serine/threonine protein kinase n=2 Tax=Pseudarthrobacter phenanthrenivorans TaxID=361575 RepID=A0A3B0FYH4_PSEPS|nr:serine/threonine-protein kinase [Pseudarthrobacter phenanthrenivorans]ADX72479.1 serine/threonine protein kinase [Pseudarthrobacter phenanthrenivorans Sphe3]RKO24849.1 serine/threonine protein kinase [Pseudarthrobacter phenanthrenivorans]TPV51460.1 serine/threonine protein kinase [Pseudarthrobacter phenanthrenivorans]
MSSKRPVAPPPRIPGFTYVSLLGSGGFSDVYLYEQDRPRRKVAVKVLLSDLKTEGARRRFESEANLMAQLSSHPYIVTIFEAEVTDDGHSYLAMEYCSRPSLDVRYRRQRFSVDEVLAVGIQVASAVETAHRAGIAHRDIKPANILVTDYNRPALTDFGISGTLAGDADDESGMSIPWSPPEQFTDGPVDGVMVDVWALGATLYTLLAGRSPFVLPGADNSQRELISRISNAPLPRLGRADVPESLELALSTAMAKLPQSRYSSAHAFALALQRIQAELNLAVTPFEVLEEPHQDDGHPDDGAEETRVRSIASIDPERTGSAPTFPARTWPQDGRGQGAGEAPPSKFPPPAPSPAPAPVAQEWAQATVLRGPAGSASAARDDEPTAAGRPVRDADAADTTIHRPARVEEPENVPVQPADRGKRNLWLAVSGGTLLALAAVVGLVVANAAPDAPTAVETQQASRPPADALDNGTVPDVESLAGTLTPGGDATFTWVNPQPKEGDKYKWRVYTIGGGGEYQSIDQPPVQVKPNPSGETCIQVMIVRSDGAFSPLEEGSIACTGS